MWTPLLLAATVWSFPHMPLGFSDRNKMVLRPGCEGRARCGLHTKNVQSVRFVVKRRDAVATSPLALRWMYDSPRTGCARSKIPKYMWREQAIIEWSWCVSDDDEGTSMWTIECIDERPQRVIMARDLYCCLRPQCEALRTCHSGFPIATL